MSKRDEIRNRTLTKNEQGKIAALAARSGADIEDPMPAPAASEKDNAETVFIGSIVADFYQLFFKSKSESCVATLTLAACVLKAGAVIAQAIKDSKKP